VSRPFVTPKAGDLTGSGLSARERDGELLSVQGRCLCERIGYFVTVIYLEWKERTGLERVSVSDRLHLLPTAESNVGHQWRRRPGIHRLSIQTVYRQNVMLKTCRSVVVLPYGGEAPCLLNTELVLRAPRWWRGRAGGETTKGQREYLLTTFERLCGGRERNPPRSFRIFRCGLHLVRLYNELEPVEFT